jgi:hypothetical protein
MWLYPKVVGFNPPERWGHSACFFEGVIYVFGVCIRVHSVVSSHHCYFPRSSPLLLIMPRLVATSSVSFCCRAIPSYNVPLLLTSRQIRTRLA